jgi:ABC-type uncharacterized transport system permease subunit
MKHWKVADRLFIGILLSVIAVLLTILICTIIPPASVYHVIVASELMLIVAYFIGWLAEIFSRVNNKVDKEE